MAPAWHPARLCSAMAAVARKHGGPSELGPTLRPRLRRTSTSDLTRVVRRRGHLRDGRGWRRRWAGCGLPVGPRVPFSKAGLSVPPRHASKAGGGARVAGRVRAGSRLRSTSRQRGLALTPSRPVWHPRMREGAADAANSQKTLHAQAFLAPSRAAQRTGRHLRSTDHAGPPQPAPPADRERDRLCFNPK